MSTLSTLRSHFSHLHPYLDMYGDFITKNAGAVSQIESALRSLTYIVPGPPPPLLPLPPI